MSENSKSTSVQLLSWQKRALENGRTPLPESPGERPWLNLSPGTEISVAPLTALTNLATPNQRWWTESEMRRLIQLRNSGESWAAIAAQFPGRTLQGVKQTYRKRRFATELQMEKEVLVASPADPSHIADNAGEDNQ